MSRDSSQTRGPRRASVNESRGEDGALAYVVRLYRSNGNLSMIRTFDDRHVAFQEAAAWMDMPEPVARVRAKPRV